MVLVDGVHVRAACSGDHVALDDLTAGAYLAAGLVSPQSPYVEELRSARRRARGAQLLVAVDGAGALVGGVTLCWPGTRFAEIARAGEAELRMLAVAPSAQGRGVGAALVAACAQRAGALPGGCRSLVCSVQDGNARAHRLYQRLGFHRVPELDWSPGRGVRLLGYARPLV